MKTLALRKTTLASVCSLALIFSTATVADTSAPVRITIAAINDLHGNLHPSALTYQDNEGNTHHREAGGIATLGGMLNELRIQDPDLLVVGAGDLIGASPASSALWADEPVIEALRGLGLNLSSSGNHEFDNGKAELLRMINGGCDSNRREKACKFRDHYPGTGFPYLAANVLDSETNELLLPAYHIEERKGVKIAFVSAVPGDLKSHVSPKVIAGIKAISEVEGINRVIPEIKAHGVNAIVAVIHQGGTPPAFNATDCSRLSGQIVDVAKGLDPAVDLLITGHTHQAYQCSVGDLPVTQAGEYGHFITKLELDVTPGQHRATVVSSRNLLVDPQRYAVDPQLAKLADEVEARSREKTGQPVARIGAPSILRAVNADGESAMGNVVADAQLAASREQGADIAFVHTRGLRKDLFQHGDRPLTYGQLFTAQPFGNSLIITQLKGAQVLALLNEQWQGDEFHSLQVSKGVQFRWDPKRPIGNRIIAQSLTLNGKPIEMDKTYGVTANDFIAYGGNNFSTFLKGSRQVDTGIADVDALAHYLKTSEALGVAVSAAGEPRIVRVK